MVNVPWPVSLKPSEFGYSCRNYDVSGGVSLAGGEQFIASPGARWTASMELPIRGSADVLTIRALRSQLQGRANPTLLPNFDGLRVSWPVEAETGRVLTPRVAHQLAGTYGLEDTIYAGPVIPPAAQINATVHPGAAVGVTQLTIRVSQGGPIKAGQQFGIANRLYEIATIDLVVTGSSVVDYTVTFKPRLRALAADGAAVQFTRPVCLMRCVNLDEQTSKFAALRYATLSLEFVEYL